MSKRPRFLVTRDEDENGRLSAALGGLGAETVRLPFVLIRPPADPAPLHRAIRELSRADWLVYTSTRAVESFRREGVRLPDLSASIACVGEETALSVERNGGKVALMPDYQRGASIVSLLMEQLSGKPAKTIIYTKSRPTTPTAVAALRAAGHEVIDPVVYQTVERDDHDTLATEIRAAQVDAILLCSPAAVRVYAAIRHRLQHLPVGSIAPRTTEALLQEGIRPAFQSPHPYFEVFAKAALDWSVKGSPLIAP